MTESERRKYFSDAKTELENYCIKFKSPIGFVSSFYLTNDEKNLLKKEIERTAGINNISNNEYVIIDKFRLNDRYKIWCKSIVTTIDNVITIDNLIASRFLNKYLLKGVVKEKSKLIKILITDLVDLAELNGQSREDVMTYISDAINSAMLPRTAPKLWSDRNKLTEKSPVSFIKSYYGEYLGNGLTQAHLKKIDPKLYQAFHDWKRHNDIDSDFILPSLSEENSRKLRANTDKSSDHLGDAARERARLNAAAKRRGVEPK